MGPRTSRGQEFDRKRHRSLFEMLSSLMYTVVNLRGPSSTFKTISALKVNIEYAEIHYRVR